LTPQLVSFFRSRGCARDLSEDLSQEVMLTVYRRTAQLRDRVRFRAWVFTIARHALYRHQGKRSLEMATILVQDIVDTRTNPMGPSAFEFHHWMTFLESNEREALTLRYVEGWEYHEIAEATAIPIGTVQSRVFNAQKKLATRLKGLGLPGRKAA
jgi:RNA polymerase sigma-70 factor (ECF subfamily)